MCSFVLNLQCHIDVRFEKNKEDSKQTVTTPTFIMTEDEPVYKYLVVDSGPIIKHTGASTLWKRAKDFYTVPAVIEEIRDAKARQHLQQLPMELKTRFPSPQSIQAVSDFARQTGDFQSLSVTDIQVMALVYEMEREACHGNMDHIRTTPKRMIGLGPMEKLAKGDGSQPPNTDPNDETAEEEEDVVDEADTDTSDEETDSELEEESTSAMTKDTTTGSQSSSWAKLVHPNAVAIESQHNTSSYLAESNMNVAFGRMKLNTERLENDGQFADAEDDPIPATLWRSEPALELSTEQELELEFPSLSAAVTVPLEEDKNEMETISLLEQQLKHEDERKKEALKPITKSGKLYNSFTKYGNLVKPSQKKKETSDGTEDGKSISPLVANLAPDQQTNMPEIDAGKSHIMGGMAFAGQDNDVEDDGEGWITSSKDISSMKVAGILDPMRNPGSGPTSSKQALGPAPDERAACATTDFAMQNVLLQMNLELLSVDGMKVRKLKSWVTRCGSCFKIYTSTDNVGPLKVKRLFCSHCGGDFLQRIACSVDQRTGRLKLHFSKRHKTSLRGTKFSLPKPSTGNRFQGDLLLREDQMLVGAWSQKVKMRTGGKARDTAQSIFGKDIASNVGCNATAVSVDDIRVGFGRRNPNCVKGRERRGKKKKTVDTACGLRRY